MEHVVSIMRSKRTGNFLLHPLGTFKGYGGFVGIPPYRELASSVDPEELGTLVVNFLCRSGPTGFAIQDIERYRSDITDQESVRIQSIYLEQVRAGAAMARRFLIAEVSKEDRRQSWEVVQFRYDSEQRSLIPAEEECVKVTEGPVRLGEVLLALLSNPENMTGNELSR